MSLPIDPLAPCPVAFEGFIEFERTALASFFRLARPRGPVLLPVAGAAQAECLVVDADNAAAVAAVRAAGRTRDAVFIGTQAPAGAYAWLTRLIDPQHIVRELIALVELRRSGLLDGVQPVPSGGVDLLLQDIGAPSPTAAVDTDRGLASTALPVAEPGGGGRPVLVVEDSAIARKFLAQRLARFGYRVVLACTGEEALAAFELQPFAIVFADITLGPENVIDGLRVCQAIKRHARSADGPTSVVIVTGQSGATARVRGSLAGCDAFLTKPLMEPEFIAALRQVDPLFGATAFTAARRGGLA